MPISTFAKFDFKWISFFSLVLIVGCGDSQPREAIGEVNMFEDATLVSMYDAADKRDALSLLPYAEHETAAYRRAFARLVGSMPDSVLLEPVGKLLADPIPYVRLEAAWAIGQYKDTLALAYLEKAIRKATIPEVKAELLEAIGKCAHPKAMAFLLRHEPNTPDEEAGKMWGIYRAAAKGLLLEDHVRVIAAHLKSGDADTRLAAISTLSQQQSFRLDDYANDLRAMAASDPVAEVRHKALHALAYTYTKDEFYASVFFNDADPTVRATAVAAFANLTSEPAMGIVIDALQDGQAWVATVAAARMPGLGMALAPETLRSLALSSPVPEVRAAAVNHVFRNAQDKNEGWQLYRSVMTAYRSPGDRVPLVRNLGEFPFAMDTLVAYLRKPAPISTAAAEAIVGLAGRYIELRPLVSNLIISEIEKADIGATTVFAQAARAPHFSVMLADYHANFLEAAERFTSPGEAEAREALLRVHKTLTKGDRNFGPPEYNHPIDWESVRGIPRKTYARLYHKGRYLEIQLLVEDAPASVESIVKLANDRFYDGLNFHRVIPGFVSQGGCPVGDGFHSVPYSLRSEFSPLRFGRGVVGLASAGTDTEGCQFFISHASAPHLEGRFTVIGAMTNGFELLPELSTGAVIDSLRISHTKTNASK